MSGLYARIGKRPLDLAAASATLLLLSPFLLTVAFAIRLESAGPVFYRQERVGRLGEGFRLVKFRSMVANAERIGAGVLVEKRDARVTRVGRWLRRWSLDELPQLFNVLAGSMSIVGPRPTLRYQVEQYDETQRRRLLVRPGITGWAQVHGRNAIAWDERIRLDLEYVERLSLATDLRILLKTIPTVVRGSGQLAAREFWNR